MLKDKIADIFNKSSTLGWSYPEVFEALKAAGVIRYQVDVSSGVVSYYTENNCYSEQSVGYEKVNVSKVFNPQSIKDAIAYNQNSGGGYSNYQKFLNNIANAGVKEYFVYMHSREIAYCGLLSTDKYCESIPIL